jgi:hypothetical protein
MGLNTKIYCGVRAANVADHEGGQREFNIEETVEYALAHGTADNKADLLFRDVRQIAASGNDDLDLAAVLEDAHGAVLTFVEVVALIVEADPDNTNDVHVGGAASNQFASFLANSSDIIKVRPGGKIALFAPKGTSYAVVAGTGDILRISNSAGGSVVDYTITIVGRSAAS